MNEISETGRATMQGIRDACRFVTNLHRERGRAYCQTVTEQGLRDLGKANAAPPITEAFRAAYILAYVEAAQAAIRMLGELN